MRLLNPTLIDTANAITGAALLADVQAPADRRFPSYHKPTDAAADIAELIAKKPAGFFESTGETHGAKPGETVAAVSVAWYTRLNDVKVVQIQFGAVVVNEAGVAEAPALVPVQFREQILASGGYPVLASERLSVAYGRVLGCVKSGNAAQQFLDVAENPGSLGAWEALAGFIDAEGYVSLAKDLRKAIGA